MRIAALECIGRHVDAELLQEGDAPCFPSRSDFGGIRRGRVKSNQVTPGKISHRLIRVLPKGVPPSST